MCFFGTFFYVKQWVIEETVRFFGSLIMGALCSCEEVRPSISCHVSAVGVGDLIQDGLESRKNQRVDVVGFVRDIQDCRDVAQKHHRSVSVLRLCRLSVSRCTNKRGEPVLMESLKLCTCGEF